MSEELRKRVSVLVEDPAGRLLVDSLPGDVEFPGGGIEPGESVEEAAIREVMEEAGVRPLGVDTFGQRPTVADGAKTYWRKAVGSTMDTSQFDQEGDGMANATFLPKPQIRQKLREPGGDPDVTADEEKAMHKVSYMLGYEEVLKTAGLWDVVKHYGRGAREAMSPVLGQTRAMVQRQDALRRVRDARQLARRSGQNPELAQERVIARMSPTMQNAWRDARDMADVLQEPFDPTFNPLF